MTQLIPASPSHGWTTAAELQFISGMATRDNAMINALQVA